MDYLYLRFPGVAHSPEQLEHFGKSVFLSTHPANMADKFITPLPIPIRSPIHIHGLPARHAIHSLIHNCHKLCEPSCC